MSTKMTPSELKYQVEQAGRESHYFSRENMKFSGDTMRNYGVTSKPVMVTTSSGEQSECWELYRRHPVTHGLRDPAYFDTKTFRRVFAAKSNA